MLNEIPTILIIIFKNVLIIRKNRYMLKFKKTHIPRHQQNNKIFNISDSVI